MSLAHEYLCVNVAGASKSNKGDEENSEHDAVLRVTPFTLEGLALVRFFFFFFCQMRNNDMPNTGRCVQLAPDPPYCLSSCLSRYILLP